MAVAERCCRPTPMRCRLAGGQLRLARRAGDHRSPASEVSPLNAPACSTQTGARRVSAAALYAIFRLDATFRLTVAMTSAPLAAAHKARRSAKSVPAHRQPNGPCRPRALQGKRLTRVPLGCKPTPGDTVARTRGVYHEEAAATPANASDDVRIANQTRP